MLGQLVYRHCNEATVSDKSQQHDRLEMVFGASEEDTALTLGKLTFKRPFVVHCAIEVSNSDEY